MLAHGFAAQLGARIALVEKHRIGSDCTWTGCVPSKTLLKAAKMAHEMRTADRHGLTPVEPVVDLKSVMAHTGVDCGAENIAAAEAHTSARGVAHLTIFRQGDAERLPFEDCPFDGVISECSFCTFPDKATAAAEMARVLRSHGRLGLMDITVNGPLPDDIQSL